MGMELTHSFTVPAGVDETWEAFQDIESVAGCFPGATVTSVEGDVFQGSCKVKLGPIALVYNGSGTFVEKDEAAKRFVVDAKGKDKRGNGTAGAKVTASFAEAGDAGSTEVTVVTDLAITGKPAQFGRGVIQDVSDKLLGQFVACLEQKVGGGGPPGDTGTVGTPAPPTGEPAVEAVEPAGAETPPPASPAPPSAPAPPRASAPRAESPRAVPPPDDDALDLGATVLPILAKTYWKQALGGLLVLLVIWRILRR
jgi:uncharacterized protein